MNRILLVAAALAICVVCSPSASAQSRSKKKPARTVAVEKSATGASRVAVINLGYVLNKYERASAIKEEMQAELGKVREQAKKQMENINVWQSALQKNDFADGTKEQYEEKLIRAKRQLEDLNRTTQARFGKAQQTQLITLWNDVQEAVKAYSAEHGIDLVMAYGDPLDQKDVMSFMNLERKMRGADQGSTVPFFVSPNADISDAVVQLLNQRYREERERATETDPSER